MDKNKIIEAAAKLVAKGAYDKAIKEYQKILDVDPKDVRILQKMGELFQKKNDNTQAATYFTKVAESYTNDGFFLKAVALYKQVLKLDPSLLEINVKLAELHQQLQLLSEAMAYFQIVANHYDKAGDPRKSLEVLKKMVDLDPDKVASRVKLADLYVREGMNPEATAEFSRAAEYLKRNNQTDDYVRVAERLSALQPDNLQLAKELAEIYLQRHDQKRALAKLQVCFKADNRDIDTLRLLAVAFQGLGQTSKTISVYKELARAWEEKGQTVEAEQVWSQVAQLDPNDGDVAARAARHAPAPAAQAAPQPAPPPSRPQAPAAQQPPHPAATAVQGAYVPPRPRGDNVAKLLTETDVYVKYGLHDKALEHLRKVFAVEPENIDAHEKAYAIYVASNNQAQAFEQLLNVLRLHTRTADGQRAQPYLQTILQQNPTHPEVQVFVATLGGGDHDEPALEAQATVDEGAIIVDSDDEALIVADQLDQTTDEVISGDVSISHQEEPLGLELISSGVTLAQPDDDQPETSWSGADQPDVADDPALLVAASGDDELTLVPEDTGSFDRSAVLEAAASAFDTHSSAFDAVPDGANPFGPSAFATTSPAPLAPLGGDADELEESSTGEYQVAEQDEFDTGTMQIPVRSIGTAAPATMPVRLGEEHEVPTRTHRVDPSLTATFSGPSPFDRTAIADNDWSDTREEVSTAASPVPSEGADQPLYEQQFESYEQAEYEQPQGDSQQPFEEGQPYEEQPQAGDEQPVYEQPVEAPPEEEPAGEEVDEATFFLEQGLYEEAREILETVLIAYPEHRRAAELLAKLDTASAPTGEAPMESSESHAFDLAQELAEELGDEPPPIAPVSRDDYQVSVEEVFAEFKKGLEKVVKPEDVDTHYDLGVAYKEMGLIDDAVSEFTIARKGCLGKRKEVDCLSMIGLLQQLKGDGPASVDAFMQALTSEHATGDVEKSLRYDLASAYETGNQPGKALHHFLRVHNLDPSFREVSANVARLSEVASPEDDAPAPRPAPSGRAGGARKVGYV